MNDTNDPDINPVDDPRLAPIFEQGPDLEDAQLVAILRDGDAGELVEPLVATIRDPELWDEAAPGQGWAPIHAAELLGRIGDPTALEPMYRVLADCDPDAILDTALTRGIQSFGEAAIAPGIEVLKELGEDFRDDLACVFAGLGVQKTVVFQVLLKNLVKNPQLGAENLATYGDPEALDALAPMLSHYLRLAAEERKHAETVLALAAAIEKLGGELTANQEDQIELLRNKMSKARQIIERVKQGKSGDHHHPDTHVRDHDLGRNDPCWCGSERKYKHCHWSEDQR